MPGSRLELFTFHALEHWASADESGRPLIETRTQGNLSRDCTARNHSPSSIEGPYCAPRLLSQGHQIARQFGEAAVQVSDENSLALVHSLLNRDLAPFLLRLALLCQTRDGYLG